MNKKVGCLITHGFGGNIEEVLPLAHDLTERGYIVKCPALKGHTGNRNDLGGIRYEDWIESVEKELIEIGLECDITYLIGFSMGGLISIDLATKYDVEAVVTINTPIYYWNFGRIAANVIHDLWCCRMGNIKRYFKASGSVTYSALISFIRLLQYTKKQVTKLDCPFYVIQALDDDTVKTKSARYIYQNIKSQKKYLKYYETGGHLLLRSATANTVIADIEGFLSALE